MSDGAAAPISTDSSEPAAQALTPERIEAALADFRGWLLQLSSAPRPDHAAQTRSEPPDLHTLLGQMIALRQEVNLQTKSSRVQQEQNAQVLGELGRALELVEKGQEAAEEQQARIRLEDQRDLLKVLVDVRDSLNLAKREVARVQGLLPALLEQAATATSASGSVPTILVPWWQFWHRSPGNAGRDIASQTESGIPAAVQAVTRVQELLDSVVAGYSMGLQRLDGALQRAGLEQLVCVGQPFDPETMEVVGTVATSERPAGEVIEEVRPGYLWEGRVFRYAQVTVARA